MVFTRTRRTTAFVMVFRREEFLEVKEKYNAENINLLLYQLFMSIVKA